MGEPQVSTDPLDLARVSFAGGVVTGPIHQGRYYVPLRVAKRIRDEAKAAPALPYTAEDVEFLEALARSWACGNLGRSNRLFDLASRLAQSLPGEKLDALIEWADARPTSLTDHLFEYRILKEIEQWARAQVHVQPDDRVRIALPIVVNQATNPGWWAWRDALAVGQCGTVKDLDFYGGKWRAGVVLDEEWCVDDLPNRISVRRPGTYTFCINVGALEGIKAAPSELPGGET